MEKDNIIELTKKGFELIETHISWVLLSDEFAYKIKKPVKFSFLDFSTIEKRKTLCDEEVRLNKRLSPDIYIEVVSVNDLDGILEFNGNGEIIEYAVKMKKLNQENRMDVLLKENKIDPDQVKEIALIVADFHKKIDVIEEDGYGSADIVKKQIDDLGNFRNTIEDACGLGKTVDFILEKSDKFIDEHKSEFEKRHSKGNIRDCHGDLHSANIFIGEKITIFDCIEFSKDFRFIDTASEIAFMAMDLDAFGKEKLAELFVDEYIAKSQDEDLRSVIQIYKCYRANVRAKIAAIEYSQNPGEESKERIRKYIELAEKYAKMLN